MSTVHVHADTYKHMNGNNPYLINEKVSKEKKKPHGLFTDLNPQVQSTPLFA